MLIVNISEHLHIRLWVKYPTKSETLIFDIKMCKPRNPGYSISLPTIWPTIKFEYSQPAKNGKHDLISNFRQRTKNRLQRVRISFPCEKKEEKLSQNSNHYSFSSQSRTSFLTCLKLQNLAIRLHGLSSTEKIAEIIETSEIDHKLVDKLGSSRKFNFVRNASQTIRKSGF